MPKVHALVATSTTFPRKVLFQMGSCWDINHWINNLRQAEVLCFLCIHLDRQALSLQLQSITQSSSGWSRREKYWFLRPATSV